MRAVEPCRPAAPASVRLQLLGCDRRSSGRSANRSRWTGTGAVRIKVKPRRIAAAYTGLSTSVLRVVALDTQFPRVRAAIPGRIRISKSAVQCDARLHRNLPREVARRVENERVPFEQEDIAVISMAPTWDSSRQV